MVESQRQSSGSGSQGSPCHDAHLHMSRELFIGAQLATLSLGQAIPVQQFTYAPPQAIDYWSWILEEQGSAFDGASFLADLRAAHGDVQTPEIRELSLAVELDRLRGLLDSEDREELRGVVEDCDRFNAGLTLSNPTHPSTDLKFSAICNVIACRASLKLDHDLEAWEYVGEASRAVRDMRDEGWDFDLPPAAAIMKMVAELFSESLDRVGFHSGTGEWFSKAEDPELMDQEQTIFCDTDSEEEAPMSPIETGAIPFASHTISSAPTRMGSASTDEKMDSTS